MWNPLSLYILHVKNIKMVASFAIVFSVDPKNLPIHKCISTSSQSVSFPFQSGSKNVNKRQGINHFNLSKFHIPLKVQMNVLK